MDIFISEYIEGSSNNKAIELYNPTVSKIDLDTGDYVIEIYFNGNSSPGNTIALIGEIEPSNTWVLADNDADTGITGVSNQLDTGNFFNGNDTILLKKSDTVIDSFGQLSVDPGSDWKSGYVSTQDRTLRRKNSVISGDTNPNDPFNPDLEWEEFPQDTFDGLASHTIADTIAPTLAELTPNDEATEIDIDTNLSIQFDEAVKIGTGNIIIYQSSDNTTVETIDVTSSQVSVSSDTVTVDFTNNLDVGTDYYIQIDSGAIADLSDNDYTGISDKTTWNFTTVPGDTTPPSLNSLTPNDDATAVAVDANFAIQFDESVQVGTGNIQLKNSSDETTVETIDITSSQVSISGDTITVDPTKDLATSTSYYIQIESGAIADLSDNDYTGISDKTTWNFTTEANTGEESGDADTGETEDDSSEEASQEDSEDSEEAETGETEDNSDETDLDSTQEVSDETEDESKDSDTTEQNVPQIEETEIAASPTTPLPSHSNSAPLNLDDIFSSDFPATSIAEKLNVESLIDWLPEAFNNGLELPLEAVDFDVSILAENLATRPTSSGSNIFEIQSGTDADDLIIGTAAAQVYCGENGDDTIAGFDGDDELCGNQGNDLIFGNTDNDTLDGGVGRDTLLAGQDNDVVLGGEDDDLVAGNYGNDELRGDGGDDLIFGNRGIDVLVGGEGEDTLLGGQDNDAVLGGDDDDRLAGERGNDDLRGEAGNDDLLGGGGSDELDGGEGDDTLFSGDRGQDTLTGGTGRDIFIVGRELDVVMDFQVGEDAIALADGLRFSDLLLRQDGDATIVSRDSQTIARLLGVNTLMLSESDFFSLP